MPSKPPPAVEQPTARLANLVAGIYAEALDVPSVRQDLSLRELGGDSLVAMSILLSIEKELPALAGHGALFGEIANMPSPVRLAATLATLLQSGEQSENGPGQEPAAIVRTGLLPDQAWFLECALDQAAAPDWLAVTALELPPGSTLDIARLAVRDLWVGHTGLRARFRKEAAWVQELLPSDTPLPLWVDDTWTPDTAESAIPGLLAQMCRDFSVTDGPLAGFGLVGTPDGVASHFLFVGHHLVCDLVSMGLISAGFGAAYQAHAAGSARPVVSDPALVDFLRDLHHYAHSPELISQLGYWRDRRWASLGRLPCDGDRPADNTMGSRRVHRVSAPLAPSLGGLRDADGADADVMTLAVAAIGSVLADFCAAEMAVKVVRHGRDIVPGATARPWGAVGRFALSGVVFVDRSDGTLARHLPAAMSAIRAVPDGGVGYSILRWIGAPDAMFQEIERDRWSAEILINYFGGTPAVTNRFTRPVRVGLPAAGGGNHHRFTKLDVNLHADRDQLHLAWVYSHNLHREQTIAMLADQTIEVIRAAQSLGHG